MKRKLLAVPGCMLMLSGILYYLAIKCIIIGGLIGGPTFDVFRRPLTKTPLWIRLYTFGYADPLWPGFWWAMFDIYAICALVYAGGFLIKLSRD